VLRRPKKGRTYGDGTELDEIDDLPTDGDQERKFRVQPIGRGLVGQVKPKEKPTPISATGTIGRKTGARRPPSSASSHGSVGESLLVGVLNVTILNVI